MRVPRSVRRRGEAARRGVLLFLIGYGSGAAAAVSLGVGLLAWRGGW